MSFKIFRTSKTRVSNLKTYKSESPRSGVTEENLTKEETTGEESSLGDMIEGVFGEPGEEVAPGNVSVSKPHVRKDDEPEDPVLEDEPPKPQYSGRMVDEGVEPSKASEVESGDLDDLISTAMEELPNEKNGQSTESKRSTSTPSKDEVDKDIADFGDMISMIRDDSEPLPPDDDKPAVNEPRDKPQDKKPGTDYDNSKNRLSSFGKPTTSYTTVTTTYSYSSKFVPTIPASFYKDIQTKLEDLIFKFECLDNEYAALQKISHKVYVETMDVKKILSNES